MKKFFLKTFFLGVIVLGAYFSISAMSSPDFSIYVQRFKIKKMERGENFKKIILGDSRALAMNHFSLPDTYNYAMSYWGGMYPYPFLLKRYLKYNRPPETLIVSMIPETFFAENDYEITNRTEHLFPSSPVEIVRQLRNDWPATVKRLKAKYLQGNIFEPKVDKTLLDKQSGFAIFHRTRRYEPFPGAKFIEMTDQDGPWTPSGIAMGQFDDLIVLARQNNIRVVVYFMPIPELYYDLNFCFFQTVQAMVADLEKKYPDVRFIKPYTKDDLYPYDIFVDSSHLNLEGVERFTKTRFVDVIQSTTDRFPQAPLPRRS